MPAGAAYHTRPMPDTPDDPVDATLLSHSAAAVVRRYSLQQLPRVREAGGLPGTEMAVEFRFGPAESGVVVDTHLEGTVVLTCQRCLQPVALPVTSDSLLAVLDTEAAADELPEDREPVVADATDLISASLPKKRCCSRCPSCRCMMRRVRQPQWRLMKRVTRLFPRESGATGPLKTCGTC
jgi:hypothetical protein